MPEYIYCIYSPISQGFSLPKQSRSGALWPDRVAQSVGHLTRKSGQGSYASGKCQGNLKFFKVRELSGNFIICPGKLNFC